MMIVRRLRPLGWAVAVGAAAISFYLVSLRVASERGSLEKVDRQIAETHRDIRQLRTELRTRASMRQLERWNGDVLALAAPSASQYLDADQLASVDALPGDTGPLNIPHTVQVAVIGDQPAEPAALPAIIPPAQAAASTPAGGTGDAESKRRQRLAMLEKKLVDDHVPGDLDRRSAVQGASDAALKRAGSAPDGTRAAGARKTGDKPKTESKRGAEGAAAEEGRKQR